LAPGTYERASAAAQCAFASIALNVRSSVHQALQWLDHEAKATQHPWVSQCIEYFKADVNWLIGRKRVALQAVACARGISREALSIGFVGLSARWGTLLLLNEDRPQEALEELKEPYRLLPSLDVKDRAEVLCSIRLVGSRIPVWINDIEDQSRAALAALPAQYTIELGKLGLLTAGGSQPLPEAAL
jgi:hypothetical protein